MGKSILIKDTTKEEREEIVRSALAACGGACDGCSACGSLGGGSIESLYQPYIDGEKEISELNAAYRGGTVH